MTDRRYLVIVPARGGSKGLAGKNIRPFAGRPLIAWTLEQARSAELIDRMIVSTDAEDIGAAARAFGPDVALRRPDRLATDTATTDAVLIHVLDTLAEQGYRPDAVVLLQATSPVRRPGRIDAAIRQFEAAGCDSLLSVSPTWHFFWQSPENPTASYDYANRPRRQDILPADQRFQENGSIYITRTEALRRSGSRLTGKISLFQMDPEEAQEIDTKTDFAIAEMLFCELGLADPEVRAGSGRSGALDLRHISHVIFDFDGVLTDNRVLVLEDGREAVLCNRSDGLGFEALRALGVGTLILSKERNPVVSARGDKLGVPVLQGVDDKAAALSRFCETHNESPENLAYVGNDLNDLEPMAVAG